VKPDTCQQSAALKQTSSLACEILLPVWSQKDTTARIRRSIAVPKLNLEETNASMREINRSESLYDRNRVLSAFVVDKSRPSTHETQRHVRRDDASRFSSIHRSVARSRPLNAFTKEAPLELASSVEVLKRDPRPRPDDLGKHPGKQARPKLEPTKTPSNIDDRKGGGMETFASSDLVERISNSQEVARRQKETTNSYAIMAGRVA